MKLNLLFSCFGPNRRSDSTLVEAILDCDGREPGMLRRLWDTAVQLIRAELASAIPVSAGRELILPEPDDKPSVTTFARMYTGIALYLQQCCGHEVFERGSLIQPLGAKWHLRSD